MLLSTFIEFKNHFGPLIVIYWIWKSLRTITKLVMNTHTCENVHRTVYWHHANSIEMCIQYLKKILSFILSCVLFFVLNTHLSIFITVSGDQLGWFRNGSSRSTTRRNRRLLMFFDQFLIIFWSFLIVFWPFLTMFRRASLRGCETFLHTLNQIIPPG